MGITTTTTSQCALRRKYAATSFPQDDPVVKTQLVRAFYLRAVVFDVLPTCFLQTGVGLLSDQVRRPV